MINKSKISDIRAYNMAIIEETLKSGGSLKTTKKKLAIGRDRMYTLRHEKEHITNSMDEILEMAEMFYEYLYACDASTQNRIQRTTLVGQPPRVTKDEVGKALKEMKRCKAAGQDGITADLLNHGGDIVVEKLAKVFSQCLRTSKCPTPGKTRT